MPWRVPGPGPVGPSTRSTAGPRPVRRRAPRRGGDRGFAAMEMAVATAIFVAFVGLVVVAGRINVAHSRLEAAARTAARTISMDRDPEAAVDEALAEAADMAGAGTSMCEDWAVDGPHITDESVTLTLRCEVNVQQSMLDFTPSVTLERTATEVLDQYRSSS